jgi:hypothetical protein
MTSVRVGAAVNALPGPRYFEKHGLLELHPAVSFPKPATLTRWRAQIPVACEIALAVPRRAHAGRDGALRFERPGARAWVDDAIAAFSPRFVVLFTGPELSTGARDRGLLEAFVASVQARGPRVVWQPRGLWEPEQAATLAAAVGCVVALDLLGSEMVTGFAAVATQAVGDESLPRAAGALAYGRIEALGTHARLGDGHLRRALDEALATGAAEVRLVVEAEDALRRAGRLASMVDGLADEESGLSVPRRRDEAGDEDDDLDDDDDDDLDGDDDGEDDDLEDEDDLDGDDDE